MSQPDMNSVYSIESVKVDAVQCNHPVKCVDKSSQFGLASCQHSPLVGVPIAFLIYLLIRIET